MVYRTQNVSNIAGVPVTQVASQFRARLFVVLVRQRVFQLSGVVSVQYLALCLLFSVFAERFPCGAMHVSV